MRGRGPFCNATTKFVPHVVGPTPALPFNFEYYRRLGSAGTLQRHCLCLDIYLAAKELIHGQNTAMGQIYLKNCGICSEHFLD